MYWIGQAFGIIATIVCTIQPLFKKKWQMLVVSSISNICFILNLIFVDQVSSAMTTNVVAFFQAWVMLWHVQKDKPVTKAENVIFLIIYVVCGSIGFKSLIDLLPIVGVVFYMTSAFQRDEQKSRLLLMINALLFAGYYVIIGSTSMMAELLAAITSAIGLYKYRAKK